MGRYELVARVIKARGLEGKVTAKPADGLPFCLYEGLACHVVPPTLHGPRHVRVDSIGELGGDVYLLGFEGVGSIDAAEQLAGRYLLAAAGDVEVDRGASPDFWLGRAVADERLGELGEVRELIETAAHDVLVVCGRHGEVLVPVVDEFVLEVPDDEASPVRTRLPKGLVEA